MAWNGTRALRQRRYFDQHRRSVLLSTGRVHRRGVYLNRSLIVTALISLDAIVLRSFCSLHNINPGRRGKAAPGNLQNLIRWARVVLDQDFLPARQLVGVGLFRERLGPCRHSTSNSSAGGDNDEGLCRPRIHRSARFMRVTVAGAA